MSEIVEAIDRLNSTIRRQNHILMEAHSLTNRKEYKEGNKEDKRWTKYITAYNHRLSASLQLKLKRMHLDTQVLMIEDGLAITLNYLN